MSDNDKEIIGIEKFDDTKILIDTDDKLLDDITFDYMRYYRWW